jgi:hypothetical protein
LYKDFSFRDRVHLQFRAELFNALNHPNFGSPLSNNAISQGSTGQITATQISNRQIQFGVRGTW